MIFEAIHGSHFVSGNTWLALKDGLGKIKERLKINTSLPLQPIL
jgi:hypothetical protein